MISSTSIMALLFIIFSATFSNGGKLSKRATSSLEDNDDLPFYGLEYAITKLYPKGQPRAIIFRQKRDVYEDNYFRRYNRIEHEFGRDPFTRSFLKFFIRNPKQHRSKRQVNDYNSYRGTNGYSTINGVNNNRYYNNYDSRRQSYDFSRVPVRNYPSSNYYNRRNNDIINDRRGGSIQNNVRQPESPTKTRKKFRPLPVFF